MNLVIDAQPVLGKRAGIGAYVFETLKRLPAHFTNDTLHLSLFSFLGREHLPNELFEANIKVHFHTLFPRVLLETSLKAGIPLPFTWFSGTGDLFLFPNFISYPTGDRPSVLIVYDLSYLRYPDQAERKNQRFLSRFVPASLKRASAVITISNFSKKEISEAYGFPEKRLHVASPGVDTTFFHPVRDTLRKQNILKKYRLPSDFILFLGTLEPRKGIEPLLRAYEMWNDRNKPALVLIGKRGWGNLPALQRALNGKIKGVIHPGYIDQHDLPFLLSQTRLFVYPSMYEGFGMPILEAMACGTPVVCGNCPSFHEIGGEILTYCDAGNPEALGKAIREALSIPPSPGTLGDGIERAANFTWDATARKIASVIKSIMNS